MTEKQVITCWYTTEEKAPKEDVLVVVTVSGRASHTTYDHALALATYNRDEGWIMMEDPFSELTVHAWRDLEPYGGNANGT